jgi:hypothetical protein
LLQTIRTTRNISTGGIAVANNTAPSFLEAPDSALRFTHPKQRAFQWNGSKNADYAALVSDCFLAKAEFEK